MIRSWISRSGRTDDSRRILKEEITEQDIADVVARWTGIPVTRMMEEEAKKLARMDEELKKRIIGHRIVTRLPPIALFIFCFDLMEPY